MSSPGPPNKPSSDRKRRRSGGGRKKWKPGVGFWCLLAALALLVGYFQVLNYNRPHVEGERLRFDTFIDLAEDGRVQSARILDQDAYVTGQYERPDGSVATYAFPYLKQADARSNLAEILLENDIPTRIDQQTGKSFVQPLLFLMPTLMLIVAFVYLFLSYRARSGLFSIRSGARKIEGEDSMVTFRDVAGQENAVTELREVADFLSNPERFSAVGAKVPRGLLLYGPPGCGKTLMARALAGEAGASFYSISGSDFVELYVGVGASRVRDLFKDARENAPAIVFIDELDAVGRRRASSGPIATGSNQEQEQALNQILSEMDGFSPTQGIILIGATNRPDILDPALLRPGRFDRAIGLELPDEKGRLEILEVHTRGKPLDSDVDLKALARQAIGMTGADLASTVNEAGLLAGRARKKAISQPELEQALKRIMETPERQRRLSMRDRTLGQRSLAEDRVTFDDVAGADEAIEELAEVKEYLADPDRFADMGARIPRGYLLVGPPGTGKTLLARAVAGESNAAFFSVAATEFVEVFVGEGAGRVRDLFAQARSVAPTIIFLDEIDSIGARRGTFISDHSERQQTLNQILVELDGFGQRAGVVVMAATNRPDILDPALIRPGRFDRTLTIDYPDKDARRAILGVHATGKRLANEADLDAIARLTRGMTGADLANVMNEAALLAARQRAPEITRAILDEAVERAGLGIAGGAKISEEERRLVSYHEAGHGLVARALPGGKIVHKLTIIPRGRALGSAWLPESDDRYVHSRSLLIERMATLLGGRAAEEMVFGEPGDGAASDLVRVAGLARRMVAELGMSKAVGAINYAEDFGHDGRPIYSEETAKLIDSEARKIVDEAHGLARQVLASSREALDKVAAALSERETLTLEEIEEIAGPPPTVPRRSWDGAPAPAPAPAGASS